jgi:hypothetical protein
MSKKQQRKSVSRSETLTIPELEQSKAAVLNTLASAHSRRSYEYALERFIAWYCDEPRLAFNRSVVVRYRTFLESLALSAATINLHLSAIRRLAVQSAETGWLSPELVTGIRRLNGPIDRQMWDIRTFTEVPWGAVQPNRPPLGH